MHNIIKTLIIEKQYFFDNITISHIYTSSSGPNISRKEIFILLNEIEIMYIKAIVVNIINAKILIFPLATEKLFLSICMILTKI